MENNKIKKLQFMISIVESGTASHVIDCYRGQNITQHIQTSGIGSAASHMLDTLGFGSADRDVILSCGKREDIRNLMNFLKDTDRSKLNTKGIALSINVSAMSAIIAVCISKTGNPQGKEEIALMEAKNEHSLILITVNQGYTDAVMETAREAGASGGTIIRGRWSGAAEIQTISGLVMQEEKEIIAILAKKDDAKHIMAAVERKHSIVSEACGTVSCVPVEYTSKID